MDRIVWLPTGWPSIRNSKPSVEAEAPLFGEAADVEEIPSEAEGFIVKPRSVRDSFTISSTSNQIPFSWQLVGLHGEVVKSGKGQRQVKVGVQDVREGLYILNIKSKNGETSQKILRQ
jgi:hypothetical protein